MAAEYPGDAGIFCCYFCGLIRRPVLRILCQSDLFSDRRKQILDALPVREIDHKGRQPSSGVRQNRVSCEGFLASVGRLEAPGTLVEGYPGDPWTRAGTHRVYRFPVQLITGRSILVLLALAGHGHCDVPCTNERRIQTEVADYLVQFPFDDSGLCRVRHEAGIIFHAVDHILYDPIWRVDWTDRPDFLNRTTRMRPRKNR